MKTFLKSTFGLVIAVMMLFAVIAVFVVTNTSDLMVKEATRTVRSVAKNTTGQIDQLMTGVETAVANQKWIIGENLGDPDYMYRITRQLVENNEHIVGSTVAFKSKYYPAKGHFFAPYTCVDADGSLKCFQLGTPENDYFEQDWYAEPMKLGKPIWSEPYFDVGGAKILMSTYSMPIEDSSTNVCAIFTADLSLERLTREVASICPISNSYAVLRSTSGAELVRPPEKRTINNGDGKSITICDQASNGWTVEIVCPIEEILRGSHQLMVRIGFFSVLGLGLIFFLSWVYTSRLQRASAARERMESELDTARNIQSGILPKDFPDNVYATLRPAREVGGDLYDFVRKGDRLYFIIGDASGKGVPAALFSFMAGTVFRMACEMQLDPGEICGRINGALSHNNEMSMFVTVFVGALDLKTGELQFGCAGHNPPVVVAPDGKARFLTVRRGPPTGAVPGACYALQTAQVEKGSKILVYTDGITEAERADRAQYGDGRLLAYAAACARFDVRDTTKGLLSAVDCFVGGNEQSDDITIMTVALPA